MEILNVLNMVDFDKPINLESLFGKDAARLSKACYNALHNSLHPYNGCYRANRPSLFQMRNDLVVPEESTLISEYKRFLERWYAEHPEEAEKERLSRESWEMYRDKQFRIIYGIAKRHGFFLKWHGNGNPCCPDQWDVYKEHQQVARICC